MKKILLALIAILFAVPSYSQTTWFSQGVGLTTKNLTCVKFINNLTGFAAGDSSVF